MSYLYGQPAQNFSNPMTPLTFPTWETMENEQQAQGQSQQPQEQLQLQHPQQQHHHLPELPRHFLAQTPPLARLHPQHHRRRHHHHRLPHAHTSVGTLTRIKIDAVQLALKDVSFYYKDLNASAISPSSFSGLLALTLPPQGISLDIKVRLIPSSVPSSSRDSRIAWDHYHIVEHVQVGISEDVKLEVKESNHGVLLAMFKPIFVLRLRDALDKTLAGQVRAAIEWADAVAYDVGRRREVFEDTGAVGGGAAFLAAIWSEVGRLKRESAQAGTGVEWRATGTGVVVEHGDGDVQFAMGAEPQILSGDKRGPLGTASEPLAERLGVIVQDVTGIDVNEAAGQMEDDATRVKQTAVHAKSQSKGLVKDGQKKVQTFQRSIEVKKAQEEKKQGWRSPAFDV